MKRMAVQSSRIVVLSLNVFVFGAFLLAHSEKREPTTVEQFDKWMEEFSNWGRWGVDDELGAANLITDIKRQEASELVKTGTTVSLAHDLITEESADAAEPYVLQMRVSQEAQNSMDRLDVDFHGTTFSHLDALCHVFYKDKTYNGFNFTEVATKDGCLRMGTTALSNGLVTRAILVDIPRLKGLDYLEPGTKVYQEDIEAWEKKVGVTSGSGDALLLRTGRWIRRAEHGPTLKMSGWDASVIPFLAERDIALLGAESVHEAPESVPGLGFNPIHRFAIVARGINLLDNLDLDAAADLAASLNRWEFMLVVAPIRVSGGTGSPVNPIAIF